jgi:anaerobic ribonucleoside-triphosphate reductase activating protein
MTLRLHAFEPFSRANGPGLRAVVWFQGCTLGCPGCFNPATHDPAGGYEAEVEDLVREILSLPGLEGVTVSGGEPFQQPAALAALVHELRRSRLGILVFSGYPIERIRAMPEGPAALRSIDALVAGPYVRALRCGRELLGSSNQRLHLLSGRYSPADFGALPRSEVILHRDGTLTVSGFPGWRQRL